MLSRFALAAAASMLLAGCQSANYRAATLPADLRVTPSPGPSQVQLSSLATHAAPSTALTAGDILEVRVLSGIEETTPEPLILQVTPRGEVDLPLVGPVLVAGLDPSIASQQLMRVAVERGIYRRPNITLDVRERATHQVTVIGAVEEPGVHAIPIGACSVLTAIAAAGGMTEEAGTQVEVLSQMDDSTRFAEADVEGTGTSGVKQVTFNAPGVPQMRVERIDLAMASRPDEPLKERKLRDGNVVLVKPREQRVIHVTGLVSEPDQFEMPRDQDIRVLDAIAMAGGVSNPSADKVYVIRQRQDTVSSPASPAVIQVSIAQAKRDGRENLILGPGDLVTVESTPATRIGDAIRDFFRVSLGLTSTAFAL